MVKVEQENSLLGVTSKTNNIKDNIISILLYALSLATALGFNDLMLTIFDGFSWTGHVLSKTTYVIIMFGITIGLAYYLGSKIKS